MKPGRRNSDDAVLKRRTIVSELYLAGRTQYQISQVVNVTPQQVSHDLKRIREQWRTTTLQNYDERIDLELAKVDHVEHDAWESWDNSIGKHTTVVEKEAKVGPETITRTEVSAGDPRFLATILKCIDIRCKIFGLYAPTTMRTSNSNPPTLKIIDAARLRTQQMNRLTDGSSGENDN